MTDTPTTPEEMREAAARALMEADDCGFTMGDGQSVFCDDASIPASHRCKFCSCRRGAAVVVDVILPRIAALEAERDRLREALRQIIDGATEYTRTECAIARAALEGGGDG